MNPQARLTVVHTLHHQIPNEDPTSIDIRYERKLDTIEQPYVRHLSIGGSWTKLDTGWLKECSLLTLKNNEGKGWIRIPTPEQKADSNSRVIEISFDGTTPHLEVRPGESHSMYPLDLSKIMIRCRNQTAKISIICFPK